MKFNKLTKYFPSLSNGDTDFIHTELLPYAEDPDNLPTVISAWSVLKDPLTDTWTSQDPMTDTWTSLPAWVRVA